MNESVRFTIPRHAVPSNPDTGLSPLQQRMLDDPAPIRVFAAPTGAGKSYAFQIAMRERRARILFIVPTRRLAQNLAHGLQSDLIQAGANPADASEQVWLWTSDERQRQETLAPHIKTRDRRLQQVRRETGAHGGGFMIIATPESVAWYLLNPALRKDGLAPENLLDLLRLDHIVFDEFHTIDARGMGISCALATLAWQTLQTARITFLSATPIDVQTTLSGFGIPREHIAKAEETVITGSAAQTQGMRAIHGDVDVWLEHGDGLLHALNTHRERIEHTLARQDGGQQVVLIYDSVRQLLAHKQALAAWFDQIGIDSAQRLAINSSDDSVDHEIDGFFTLGRDNDPRQFPVLVATSSVEMGVTFKAGLILMEPGHDATSFVQRIGRVARGDLPGQVIVHITPKTLDRHAWLRQLQRDLPLLGTHIPVDQFIQSVLTAVHQRFAVTEAELHAENGMFRRMPQCAIWAAGLFWAALERSAHYKGMRDTLRSFRPKPAARIGALLHRLEKSPLDAAQRWSHALLSEAKRLRMILPKVTLVDPDGRRKAISWHLYASTEELLRAPAVLAEDGALTIYPAQAIIDIEQNLGGIYAKRHEEALFPHTGNTRTLELQEIRQAWLRAVKSELRDPGLSDAQIDALETAQILVQLTSIVPIVNKESITDGANLIL